MFKKTIVFLIAISALLFSNIANAADIKPYLGLNIGVGVPTSTKDGKDRLGQKYNSNGSTSLYVGLKVNNNYRTEIAYLDNYNDSNDFFGLYSDELELQGAMWNNYYDFKNSTNFTPYVGFGIGAAKLNNKINILGIKVGDDSATVSVYQPKAGIAYDINEHHSINLGYSFITTSTAKLNLGGDDVNKKYQANNYEIGYRYTF